MILNVVEDSVAIAGTHLILVSFSLWFACMCCAIEVGGEGKCECTVYAVVIVICTGKEVAVVNIRQSPSCWCG